MCETRPTLEATGRSNRRPVAPGRWPLLVARARVVAIAREAIVSHWRTVARPIVRAVIERVGPDRPVALRAALWEAYPWAVCAGGCYRAWVAECQAQAPGGLFGRRSRKVTPQAAGQLTMF
jgi:hypothetical protein